MASRESQGLQVALILFVMVTVVLAVTTFLYFRTAEEKIKEAASARSELARAQKGVKDLENESKIYKHMLGIQMQQDADLTSIWGMLAETEEEKALKGYWDQYEKDMAMYGAGFDTFQTQNAQGTPPAPLSYRSVPKYLAHQLNDRNQRLATANTLQRGLEADLAQTKQEMQQKVAAAQSETAAKAQELEQAKNRFSQVEQGWVSTGQTWQQEKPTLLARIQSMTDAGRTKEEEFTRREREMQLLIDSMIEQKKKQEAPTFERPDGEITMVNEAAQIVWINLGHADGAARMMTFSVVDQDALGVSQAEIKGSIEITKVKEAHLSEARVVPGSQADLSKPIMRGDLIYSPSFRKGQKTHFALAGVMDIDGDGKDDRERVKALITTSGGVVDAELLDDGSIAGKMTVETKYLVKGDRPTDSRNDEKLLKNWSQMTEDATRLGVQTWTVNDLLDRMGYVPETRVVPLNRSGGTGGARSDSDGRFRARTPPPSAYGG
jgi:hypothetical protein